jgi:predicted nucleic acid-binding protein
VIVYLDTNIVIYAVEDPPIWGPQALARLTTLQAKGDTPMVSDLTRMECLVGPLKSGNSIVESEFRAFFAASGMQVVSITAAVCDRAALIRAANNFKHMDSLHLAAAVLHGANVFLTNDARLNSFTGLTVEVLT